MRLSQTITRYFKKFIWPEKEVQASGFICPHGPTEHSFKIVVLGVECEFDHAPMCVQCSEKYLNMYSTLCSACERPIYPGSLVGVACCGKYKLVHHTTDCSIPGSFCGRWGEGKLLPSKYLESNVTKEAS